MTDEDLDPAAAARVAVEEARYRDRYGTDADSLATPQPDPRTRRDVPLHPRCILGACERTARCTCQPAVAGKDLRGVCMCIDLVFSYSIDARQLIVFSLNRTSCHGHFFLSHPLLSYRSKEQSSPEEEIKMIIINFKSILYNSHEIDQKCNDFLYFHEIRSKRTKNE